jgi:hypothetical protein
VRERITDDCPRCGWHGYFHHYLATVDGDWAAAVCDDCDAERPLPPVRLRDVRPPRRACPVAPLLHPLVQVPEVSHRSCP